MACGAAGGIAATFNAPIAGPFFAMELILRDVDDASRAVWASAHAMVPIIDADGRYRGCVTAAAVAETLADTDRWIPRWRSWR